MSRFAMVSSGSGRRFSVGRALRERIGRSKVVLATAISLVAGGLFLESAARGESALQ